ncbi:endonuclease domain-containing protein [Kitasatospora sp. NPDC087314]|uniref:endonuclease domain-containing protein n=1 Tax=Kitasatospora sp. NPDC087314 TaxID=3364068 RepID=UPI00381DFB5C
MTRPDPHDVLAQWLAAGFGKHGRALQGTTPTRYEADLRDWLYFTEETTGIGAWNADASTASTWAYAPALRRPNPDRPSRRPLAPRVSLHNPARRLAALAAFYAYAAGAGHIPEPPFNAAALRPAPTALPRTAPLTLEQAAGMQFAADDVLPGRRRRGPYDTAPHRDRLLVHLLLDGLRPRQAIGIDLEDLHEEDPHRRVRTLTCPASKGDGTITHQPSREVWQAIADYLPHRVDGRDPDTGRRPLLTSRNGRRLDSNTMPGRIVKAVAARVPELIFEPNTVTPDRLAMAPAVLLDHPLPPSAPDGWAPPDAPPLERLRLDLRHALDAAPLCPPVSGGCPADCERCAVRRRLWAQWEQRWSASDPAYLSWPLPPYDHRQRPAERLLAYHRGRCAICGAPPEAGRPAHTEDHDPHTGLTRGLLCHRCRPQAEQGAAPFWVRYHERPPAAVLGLELRYPALRTELRS